MRLYDAPKFSDLPENIRGMFSAAGQASFFNLPGWYEIVAAYGLDPAWQTRLYATENSVLVSCVGKKTPDREIRGCCNLYTIEHAILLADGLNDPSHEIRQLAFDMARGDPGTSSILLSGLDLRDPSFASVLDGFKDAGFIVRPYFCWGTWYEAVEALDFDAYLAARPSILRNTWRRKSHALAETATVDFHVLEDGDVETFIADYDDVCRRSWKGKEPFPGFIPALIRMAHREGALRAGVLKADGATIAAQFWLVHANSAVIYKLAYDEKWGRFSPGTLLTMHMIGHVLSRDRPLEISFGRGDDGYKKLWMSARRERWGIEAANPRTREGLARSLRIRAAILRDKLLNR